MKKSRLNTFLIDDVKKLVAFISENEAAQAMATPGTGFDTLNDFADYWSFHINELSE